MPPADIERQIDALYQLPLEEFTPARNALAKALKRPAIKELEKPNIAAWAVNQLYWKQRATYDRLIKAAERLRGEHRKLLTGKAADIRDSEKTHREAIREAADRIRQLLTNSGHATSDATMNAVQETLAAVPTAAAPGRLTRPLQPMGFEALSGVSISPSQPSLRIVEKPARAADTSAAPSKEDRARERQLAKQREKEEQDRKERQRQAQKALEAAEAAMLKAEDAVKKAEKSLAELRATRDEAVSEYQRARLRAHE